MLDTDDSPIFRIISCGGIELSTIYNSYSASNSLSENLTVYKKFSNADCKMKMQ